MVEQWKPVAGYEGDYEVSNFGRVRSLKRSTYGRILRPCFDGRKHYLHVSLSKNGVSTVKNVHRIVAIAFLENPDNLPEVNHKDEDKTNNCANNLEWCSHVYNNRYGSKRTCSKGSRNAMSRISEDTVREIRRLYIPNSPEFGVRALSKRFNISETHTCAIIKRRRWGWLT